MSAVRAATSDVVARPPSLDGAPENAHIIMPIVMGIIITTYVIALLASRRQSRWVWDLAFLVMLVAGVIGALLLGR